MLDVKEMRTATAVQAFVDIARAILVQTANGTTKDALVKGWNWMTSAELAHVSQQTDKTCDTSEA